MKKLLAFLLAMTLVFTSVAFAFADEEISGDAQICLTLGMLKGDGNGVTAEYLATTPTRLQTAVMFLRLKGLEETALAYTSDKNFADADQVAWEGGRNIMAYLYNNPDLGWVGDGGNFNPTGIMTAQAYYKVMLETLGYKQNTATVMGDFLWANVVEFAAEHGLKAVADVENFTVNDLATATVEALQATVKGAETTLVESLVADGIVEEDVAMEAGLVETPLQKAIAAAQEAIAAIPAVDVLTLDDEATVTAAADAIDAVIALDAEAVVEGADVVDAALAKITELQTAAAAAETLAAAKKAAEDAITALANPVALENKDAVVAARALVAAAQALDATVVIANEATLVAAEAKITELEAAAVAEAAKLKVENITANTLRTMVVTFNNEVNDDTVVGDDTIKLYYGTTKVAGITAVVADDNKTVYVYTTGNMNQMKNYKLVINGVEAKDNEENVVTGYENTFMVSDVTAPEIVSVDATSPKTLELQFSEPVSFGTAAQVYSTVKIDGVNTFVSNVDATDYYTTGKVVLTLGTKLSVGNHTVKVTGINDFAGFPITAKEFAIAIAADTTAPKVTSATMRAKDTLRVVFDEPVDATSVGNGDFRVDTTNTITGVNQIDSKTFDITLNADLGKAALVEVVLEYETIKDFYGNYDSTWQEYTFTVEDDTTAPTVTNVTVTSANKVEITFSETIANATLADVTLYDSDNDKVTIAGTFAVKAGDTTNTIYVLDLTGKTNYSGTYTIKWSSALDITDNSVRANKFVGNDISVAFNDLVAPTIASMIYDVETGAGENDKIVDDSDDKDATLTIYFSEAMDAATLANESNYIFGNTLVSEMSGVTVTVADDRKSVTFVVDASVEYTFAAKNIYVLAVKDAAGTILDVADMNQAQVATLFAPTDTFANLVSKVEATSKNTLKITMKSGMLISAIDPNLIAFEEADGGAISALQVMGVSIAADGKTATLSLNNNMTEDVKYDGDDVDATKEVVKMITTDDGAITLTTGQQLVATAGLQNIIDKTIPTVYDIAVEADGAGVAGNDMIDIIFNEPVTTIASTDFDITVYDITDEVELLPTTEFTLTHATSATQTITIIKDGVAGHKFSVTINNGRFIVDGNNNSPAALDATTVVNAAGDDDALISEQVLPTITDVAIDTNGAVTTIVADDTIVITFSESLDEESIAAITGIVTGAVGDVMVVEGLGTFAGATIAVADLDLECTATWNSDYTVLTLTVDTNNAATTTLVDAAADNFTNDATAITDIAGNEIDDTADLADGDFVVTNN